MELKTKYQYTYFIYPYVIKENRYIKYLLRLLKDKNCKLRTFRKDKDLGIYSYFSNRARNYMFNSFNLSKSKLEKFEEKKASDILKSNTLFLSKKNGKYGYVDKKGNPVTDYIYDDATEQNEYGYAAVKRNGLWGSVDRNGKEAISPKYNLENNIKIDFIGRWHLGEDLNMNYYCEK